MNISTGGGGLVQEHPSTIDAYLRHGWRLVPLRAGKKAPLRDSRWNHEDQCLQEGSVLPLVGGYGLAHAYSGTMALDIDEWDAAVEYLRGRGVDLPLLYEALDAVTIDSGKPGHGKLLYRMPLGCALPSKKLVSGGRNFLDFRCATRSGLTVQDVLPPHIHPDTGTSYQWGGKGHWTRLPLIPEPLLGIWQGLVQSDSTHSVVAGGSVVSTSWDEITSLLDAIPPDIDRDSWISVGQCLHWAGTMTNRLDEAYYLWDEWSAKGAKYKGGSDLANPWMGFNASGGRELGTLFHIAKSHGWTRAAIDLKQLFHGVKGVTNGAPTGFEYACSGVTAPIPELDLTAWPTQVATRAQEISDSVGCDPITPLLASLAAVCGVADSRSRLELAPGFEVPPVLWLMTLGEPADKKTPGSAGIFRPLFALEAADRSRYRDECARWEVEEVKYKKGREAVIAACTDPDTLLSNDAPIQMPELPPAPIPLKIIVQDITSQRLVRNCADRPEGVLCYLDEMSAWVRKMCDKHSGEDRASWLTAYQGLPYHMERVGAGAIYCDNLAVSVYGNLQPKVFSQYLQSMADDGLVQRFIPARLRPRFTRRGNPIPEIFTSSADWEDRLHRIRDTGPQTYRLSAEAASVFDEFQCWYYRTLDEERLIRADDRYMTAFGKLEGLYGRLALVFHLMTDPSTITVSGETARLAFNAVTGYVVESLRYVLGDMSALLEDAIDIWVREHVLGLSGVASEVTLSDLKRSARRQLVNIPPVERTRVLEDAVYPLEKAGWVLKAPGDRRDSTTWIINPQIAETYRETRDRILDLKQMRLDAAAAKAAAALGRPVASRTVKR